MVKSFLVLTMVASTLGVAAPALADDCDARGRAYALCLWGCAGKDDPERQECFDMCDDKLGVPFSCKLKRMLSLDDDSGAFGGLIGLVLFALGSLLSLAMLVGWWKVHTKAGQPGWASFVPIYNLYVLIKIANKPIWWLLLFMLPCINFLMFIPLSIAIAKRFGKGAGFGIGMALLPFIFIPILGFGSATYQPEEPVEV